MKLAIINGSPRRRKSNSKLLIDQFLAGYRRVSSDPVSLHYLGARKHREDAGNVIANAEIVLIVFPLYTDCMPGIVKEFFEGMAEQKSEINCKIGFIVQSGFPEAIHSIYLERYLKKFTARLHCEYLGTVIKGGVEGIQIMPPWMTKKLFTRFQQLGEYFARHQAFDPEIQSALRKPLRMSPARRLLFGILGKTGLTNFYWNSNLKKHGAFEKRFDKPYILP